MECRAVEPLLPGYAEGSLSPAEAGSCATHLSRCPACRITLRQLDRLPALLRAWETPAVRLPAPDLAAARIVQKSAAAQRRPWSLWPGILAPAAAAAALAALTFPAGRPGADLEQPAPLFTRQEARRTAAGPQPPGVPRPLPPTGSQLARQPAAAMGVEPSPSQAPRPPAAGAARRAPRRWPRRARILARRSARPVPPVRTAPADAGEPGSAGVVLVEGWPAPGGGLRVVRLPEEGSVPLVRIADDYEYGRRVTVAPAVAGVGLEERADFAEATE